MTDIEKKLIAIKEDLRGDGLNEVQINKISDSIIELSQDIVRFVVKTMQNK